MRRMLTLLVAAGMISMLAGTSAPATAGTSTASTVSTPLWVKHARLYPGGISNGVRAYLDPAVIQAQALYGAQSPHRSRVGETAARQRPDERRLLPAAAAERDESSPTAGRPDRSRSRARTTTSAAAPWSCGRATAADTGRARRSFRCSARRATSATAATRDRVQPPRQGVLPRAAVLLPHRGRNRRCRSTSRWTTALTWTPGRRAAIAATNYDPRRVLIDDSIFNDKEYIAVDNDPHEPATTAACTSRTRSSTSTTTDPATPARSSSSYTDTIPCQDPSLTVWSTRTWSPTTRVAAASASRPTSSPCRWWSRAAPWTSRTSSRSATRASTTGCGSSSRRTAARASWRAP